MTDQRWQALMSDEALELTVDEKSAGWHFCTQFDGLLVGPGMPEREFCQSPCPKMMETLDDLAAILRSGAAVTIRLRAYGDYSVTLFTLPGPTEKKSPARREKKFVTGKTLAEAPSRLSYPEYQTEKGQKRISGNAS